MRLFSSRAALLSATLLSGALAVVGGSVAAQAKTLVYCSEGSPEGFDAALYSTNSTWDASSETVYDRLTEFKAGTTEIEPGLAESWTISDDNLEYVLKLRQGVQFQTTDYFTPSREFNAD
ncbi:MAG: ABC transporter substrate-binding protein, partial [Brucellaceae bacterium]|nr:ABC transporter substrate-binding protein [Brucellaceae bacterium]